MYATRDGCIFFNLSFQNFIPSGMNTSTAAEISTVVETKMGRPRGFDEDAVLEAAMRVFWEKSYEGATLSDLTKAMGINRSSMYAAFGDKEALFKLVLGRYREGPMTYIREALHHPTLRGVIEGLLYGTVEFLAMPYYPQGCLSVQGALACGTNAGSVRQSLIEWRKKGEAALRRRFSQARKDGEMHADPADVARYVSTIMTGLSIQAVNGASKGEMKRIADMAIEFMADGHLLSRQFERTTKCESQKR